VRKGRPAPKHTLLSEATKTHILALRTARLGASKIGKAVGLKRYDVESYLSSIGAASLRGGRMHDASPTLDKVDNAKGYVRGNCHVISWRANRLKSDGNADEHEKIAAYIRSKT
jgi:hypothetical protein